MVTNIAQAYLLKAQDTFGLLRGKMSLAAGVFDEIDVTALSSHSSGFHLLDLNSNFRAEDQPKLRLWFDGNSYCVECREQIELKDAWVSVSLAASLCKFCAGQHRSLGRQFSVVKSLSLDVWTPEEVCRLHQGGNGRLREALGNVLSQRSSASRVRPTLEELQKVYGSAEACAYRARLDSADRQSSSGTGNSGDRNPQAVGALSSSCVQVTATSSNSHADALAQRPGYFRTEHGFGCVGTGSRLSPVPERWSRSFVASLFEGVFQSCMTIQRELPSLGTIEIAEIAGIEAPSIFQCAENGDVAGVEALVQKGRASVHDVDELGWTPLFYAAKFGRDEVCRALFCLGKSKSGLVNVREKSGMRWTPLHYAAEMGRVGCVRLLLQAGACPDGLAHVRHGRTPLRLAAFNRRAEVVDLLLGFGADPSLLQSEGGHPIYRPFDGFHADYVRSCLARCTWERARKIYLIRDKAGIKSGPNQALVQLLRRQSVFFCVAKYL